MLKLDDLIALIGTCSPAEKAYFKRNSQLNTNYMAVYRLLDEYTEHLPLNDSQRERLAIQAFRVFKKRDVWDTAQHFLGKTLLKMLRFQKNDLDGALNKEETAKVLIQDGKTLTQKGIFTAALEKYAEAAALAEKYHYPALVCEALRGWIYLATQKNYPETATQIERLQTWAQMEKDEHDYFLLQYRALLLYRQTRREAAASAEALETHPLLQNLSESSTFLSSAYFHTSLATIAAIKNDRTAAHGHFLNLLIRWDKYPHEFKEERPRLYIVHLYNFLSYCNTLRSFGADFKHYMALLETAPTPSFDDEAEAFQNRIFLEQQHLLNTGELEKVVNLLKTNEKRLEKYKAKLTASRKSSLYFNHIIALFALEKYEEALDYCERFGNINWDKPRLDIQFFIKIFRVLIYYELNHETKLENMVQSTQAILHYHGVWADYDHLVLNYLHQLVALKLGSQPMSEFMVESRRVFAEFHQTLLQYAANQATPLGFHEMRLWAKSGMSKPKASFRALLLEELAGKV